MGPYNVLLRIKTLAVISAEAGGFKVFCLFVFLCPEAPKGSNGSVSGLKCPRDGITV